MDFNITTYKCKIIYILLIYKPILLIKKKNIDIKLSINKTVRIDDKISRFTDLPSCILFQTHSSVYMHKKASAFRAADLWLHFGQALAVANLVFSSFNFFCFLIPVYLPKAFKIYRQEGKVQDKPLPFFCAQAASL